MSWMLFGLNAVSSLVLPLIAVAALFRTRRELADLRDRVRKLESECQAPVTAAAGETPPPLTPALLQEVPAAPAPPQPLPQPIRPATTGSEREFFDSARAEELVGGLWFQNVGAVLLLIGAFFSILWGYTTGRFGPLVLVVAGAVLGLALMWRGDRLARTLAPLGHALIGVGLGVVYLSVYLGWFTLHVLPSGVALVLLTLVSLGCVLTGLAYRAQGIAALGVVGAFLPQVLSGLLSLRGFEMSAPELIGYVTLVDLAVFALCARAGWAMLDLVALTLTSVVWVAAHPGGEWGWPAQLGLALLYWVAGLAPVARLSRTDEASSVSERAVITVTPLLFAATSWPFLEHVGRMPAAILLLAASAVYLAAAWWIDSRRESGDAWQPLTAAATLFATLALERASGADNLSLAWLLEGAVLVALGTGRRGAWLRGIGAVVSMLGGFVHLVRLFGHEGAWSDSLPFVHVQSLRDLAGIALLVVTAALLHREQRFGRSTRLFLARAWITGAMLMLMLWGAQEANHLARVVEGGGRTLAQVPVQARPALEARANMLKTFATSVLWTLQAMLLVSVGWRRKSSFLRWLGLGLLGLTVMKFVLSDLAEVDVFWRFTSAMLVGVVLMIISFFYQRRIKKG